MLAALERGEHSPGLWPLQTGTVSTSLVFSEQNLERQVLQTQCRRLEAQHYSLSLTAEQLSHSMAVSPRAPHVGARNENWLLGVFLKHIMLIFVQPFESGFKSTHTDKF